VSRLPPETLSSPAPLYVVATSAHDFVAAETAVNAPPSRLALQVVSDIEVVIQS
jgi:hypothetical protein